MSARIDCPCPKLSDGAVRHPAGDEVSFRDHLDFRAGMTARNRVLLAREEDPDIGPAEILTLLTEVYLLEGIERWTLVDEKGKLLPVTRPNIRERLLSDIRTAIDLGDHADSLYAEAVMLPLLQPASTSSPGTRTEPSTSRKNGQQRGQAPRPSKRSSTTTTPTDATGTTTSSPGGAYS